MLWNFQVQFLTVNVIESPCSVLIVNVFLIVECRDSVLTVRGLKFQGSVLDDGVVESPGSVITDRLLEFQDSVLIVSA